MWIKMFQRMHGLDRNLLGLAAGFLVCFLIVALTSLLLVANGDAKDWPSRPITIIVPWPAGSSADLSARAIAPKMSQILGVPIQVVNKPGGGGIIGALEAVKSAPDGYTIFSDCGGTNSIQFAWGKDLPYKPEERTYIARTGYSPESLLVPTTSPVKTVAELVNTLRTNPSSVSFGMIGGTGVPDAALAKFLGVLTSKGIDHSKKRMVTYKGSGESIIAVAGGHVNALFAGVPGVDALVQAGKVRVLAVTSPKRYKIWPTVPTMIEAGYPSVDILFSAGLSGPPGMPANVVKILENAAKEATSDPAVIAKFASVGFETGYQPSNEYKKFVFDEMNTIKNLGLK